MALTDFDLVLFGGGGDLSMRKLIPALYARDRAGDLPPTAQIICVGRHGWNQEEFVNALNENAKPHISEKTLTPAAWDKFCTRIKYVSLDASNVDTYQPLNDALRDNPAITRVFYLATPPTLFAKICHNLSCLLYTSDAADE